jgi:hypothetical protein
MILFASWYKALAYFGAYPQLLIDRAAIAIHHGDAAAFDYLDQAEAGLAQMPKMVRGSFAQMILKNRTLAALGLDGLEEARAYCAGLGPDDADHLLARIERGDKEPRRRHWPPVEGPGQSAKSHPGPLSGTALFERRRIPVSLALLGAAALVVGF